MTQSRPRPAQSAETAARRRAQRAAVAADLDALDAAEAGWAGLNAADRAAAMRVAIRVVAKLARLTLRN
jgi:hypothetical protein